MKIFAYYNEFNPKASAWLRQLIKNGNITPGEVDERSITEVKPGDLNGFDRCHFFAGIGTWDYCLNQSGWGDRPVWTASLPCQPFSAAGKGLGKSDERHLLPHFLEFVRQCKPGTIIGEQVESAITHGWLDDLQTTMEAEGYAVGHCVLGAHSIGAAHIRQRLYWVADSKTAARERTKQGNHSKSYSGELINGMGVSDSAGSQQRIEATETARHGGSFESTGGLIGMGDTEHDGHLASEIKRSNGSPIQNSQDGKNGPSEFEGASSSSSISWIYCRDNKYRPVKPSIQPLVDGLAKGMVYSSDPSEPINANETQEARVMRLQGYGNAIQAQTATEFIKAYMGI